MKRKVNNKLVKRPIPEIFKPFLWSYDIKKMDLDTSKKTVIEQVLDFGTFKASKLLLSLYPKKTIIDVLKGVRISIYNHKSLSYWYKMFDLGSLGPAPKQF